MKRFFSSLTRQFVLALLAATLTGALTTACQKNEDAYADYSATDEAAITKFLADSSITNAQKQSSGIYFRPLVTNTSAKLATVGANASILFTGQLLDGTVFTSSASNTGGAASFVLGNSAVPTGIQYGVLLMHVGDKADLFIPSALAYGRNGFTGPTGVKVPANTVVRFRVELIDLNFAATDDAIIRKYLIDNNITNFQKQPSGLYYVPGTTNPTGTQATAGKTASVLYTGRRPDNTVFDSSPTNAPISFVVGAGQVIAGWDEGIALMRKGEKGQLLIPSALAYGPSGRGTSIPPNTVLRFEVEVTDVK